MTFHVSRVTLYVTRFKPHFVRLHRFCRSLTTIQADNMETSDVDNRFLKKEGGGDTKGAKKNQQAHVSRHVTACVGVMQLVM